MGASRRPSGGFALAGAAWLPALLVLLVPAWLLLRATGGDGTGLTRVTAPATLTLLVETVLLAASVVVISAVIACSTALLVARTDLPGRRIWSILLALPLAVPSYMGAFAAIAAFGPNGLLAERFGAELPEAYGPVGAALVLALLAYPYLFLPLRAALLGVDPKLEESARTLGLTPIQTLRRVTLPLVRPALIGGALMVALYVLSDFGAVALLQVDTFTSVIYTQHDAFDRSGAAALALVLVAVTGCVLLLEGRARRTWRGRLTATRSTAVSSDRLIRLGRWRWLATAWCSLVVLAAVGVPLMVTAVWASSSGATCTHCEPLGTLALNSVTVAGLTAVVCMVLALFVVRYATFGRHRRRDLPRRLLYSGFALPGIVVALAMVFMASSWVPVLYQTLPLLVVACTLRFLPQATDGLAPAMAQVRPSLEEASRTLGHGRLATFRRVTMPLIRRGWIAGGVLVFLTTIKELPATLVLRPTGFETLATELWDLSNEAFLGAAAERCILIVCLGVLPMLVLLAREVER